MDMNINIYVPDELGEKVKKADLEVSRICQGALAREVEEWEARTSKRRGRFERVEVETGDPLRGRPIVRKAFIGRWLVQGFESDEEDLFSGTLFSVALTKRGKFAVLANYGGDRQLHVYDSLEEAKGKVPTDLWAVTASALSVNRVIELDI